MLKFGKTTKKKKKKKWTQFGQNSHLEKQWFINAFNFIIIFQF